jgi:tetratricopeptide (TPR) repeat protein
MLGRSFGRNADIFNRMLLFNQYNFYKIFAILCLGVLLSGCAGKERFSFTPLTGVSPIIAAGFSAAGNFLFTKSADEQIRVWDTAASSSTAGRQIRTSRIGDGLVMPDVTTHTEQFSLSINKDGSVGLSSAAAGKRKAGKELVRFYSFSHAAQTVPENKASLDDTDQAWISIADNGYYAASLGADALIGVKAGDEEFTLNQFSEVLHRPDLLRKDMTPQSTPLALPLASGPASGGLADLLRKNLRPPQVTILEAAARGIDGGVTILVKVAEQQGGLGSLAVYSRNNRGQDVLEDLIEITAERAERTYKEKGKTCYELRVSMTPSESAAANSPGSIPVGVSVFNKQHTMESERRWGQVPTAYMPTEATPAAPAAVTANSKPALYVFLATMEGGKSSGNADSLRELFSRQETGSLYSKVDIREYSPEPGKPGFNTAFDELAPYVMPEDVFVFCITGSPGIDEKGDFVWQNIGKWDLLENILKIKARHTLALLETETGPAMLTAFDRLRERLSRQGILALPAAALLAPPDPAALATTGALAAVNTVAAADNTNRYIGANAFISYTVQNNDAGILAGFPAEDFLFLDRFLDPGELRIRTLFPGTLTITRVSNRISNGIDSDSNTAPVETLHIESMETHTRQFPEGSYVVTLAYRNGYREIRTAEVLNNRSVELAFNYRPRLSAGSFSGALPSFGVYVAELNPTNYQKIDTDAMQAMGMESHYVRFLSGAKFFRDGDYDKAIAEYTQAIALKSDYAEAYNYRGYLYSEKGDMDRAIADYNRALSFNAKYTDAYINRGYAYGEKGDIDRAIADYTRAIELEPKNAPAYNKRGSLYYQKGDDDNAIRDYSAAIKLKPDYALAYNNRGNVWYSKGDADRAIADLDRAIVLDAKFARAYRNRGSVWRKKGENERAAADFAAAERLGLLQ